MDSTIQSHRIQSLPKEEKNDGNMKRLDQGHLNPKSQTDMTRVFRVGGEHSKRAIRTAC